MASYYVCVCLLCIRAHKWQIEEKGETPWCWIFAIISWKITIQSLTMILLYSVWVLQLRPMRFAWFEYIQMLLVSSSRCAFRCNGDDDGDDFINAAKWLLVFVFGKWCYKMQQSDIGLRESLTSAHTEHAIFPFVILKTHTHMHTDTRTHAMYFAPSALWPVLIHISSMPSEKLLLSQLNGRFYNAVARVSVYTYTNTATYSVHIRVYMLVCVVCMLWIQAFLLHIQ